MSRDKIQYKIIHSGKMQVYTGGLEQDCGASAL